MRLDRRVVFTTAAVAAFALGFIAVPSAFSQSMGEKTVMVGGAAMYPSKNIIENAVNSKDHTTLVAAVKAAGLVTTLEGPGPFPLAVPQKGTVETLLKPENKDKLVKILTYHVVPTEAMANAIKKMIKDDGGQYTITTVSGGKLIAMMKGERIELQDENGGVATVTLANVKQSNGVIHVIDHVLLPK